MNQLICIVPYKLFRYYKKYTRLNKTNIKHLKSILNGSAANLPNCELQVN